MPSHYLIQAETAERWYRAEQRVLEVIPDEGEIPLSEIMRKVGNIPGADSWPAVERLRDAGIIEHLEGYARNGETLYRRVPG